jgi:hypothetical protein
MPIEPYTPEIDTLTLSYRASANLSEAASVRFHHLTPFGYATPDAGFAKEIGLLHAYPDAGELYLGIGKLLPGQSLSLLFQLAEGSAPPLVEKPNDHVRWEVLCGNTWKRLEHESLDDQTGQLTRTGIVRCSIPGEAGNGNPLFAGSALHWLRATVATAPEAVCSVVRIIAQAVKVTRLDRHNAPETLSATLPAGSITKLVVPDAAVKSVEQPFQTFGGRPREETETFYTRTSERLRHKNRSITRWDYERMLLEEFPQLYKVKCLNHTYCEADDYREQAPGHITVVAIPHLLNHNSSDPLRPATNIGDLELIREFLKRHTSPFVTPHAVNPSFERIRVECNVKFLKGAGGGDQGIAVTNLQDDLVRFLSPWAYEEGSDLSFGGRIHKSSLIDFIEERSYVDYVTGFKLYLQIDADHESEDLDEVTPSKPVSVLVAAPAATHKITPI